MNIYHENRISLEKIGAKTPMFSDGKTGNYVASLAQAVFVRIDISKRTLF